MDVKGFATWVKKNNFLDYKRSVFATAGYVCVSFLYVMAWEESMLYRILGAAVLIIIALEVGRFCWDMYLNVMEDEITGKRMSISQVVRLHAFPAEEYLRHVFHQMKRPSTWILSFSFVMVMTGIWQEDGVWYCEKIGFLTGLGIVCSLCPYALVIIEKKLFYHQLKMGKEGLLPIVLFILEKIMAVVEVIFFMCAIVLAVVVSWILLYAALEPPVDETVILLRNYHWDYSFAAILVFVLARAWLFWNRERGKVSKFLQVLSIVCFFSGILLMSCGTHIYTEFAGDEFRICNLWRKEVYSIQEVTGFRLYEAHGDIQMDIDFGDRKAEKILGIEQTYSELFGETFDNEYLFLLDYVGRLQKLGVKGEAEGEKDVEEFVRGFYSEMLGEEI
ncbi:MAG: hypothetical protein NC307_03080 [Roseburia sp.]|nr:hypothetical protein [Roseburia sp.]